MCSITRRTSKSDTVRIESMSAGCINLKEFSSRFSNLISTFSIYGWSTWFQHCLKKNFKNKSYKNAQCSYEFRLFLKIKRSSFRFLSFRQGITFFFERKRKSSCYRCVGIVHVGSRNLTEQTDFLLCCFIVGNVNETTSATFICCTCDCSFILIPPSSHT